MPPASPLPRFLALYAALFAAFGAAAPFLPSLLLQKGLTPEQLGFVLAGGTLISLLAGPLGGRLADRGGRVPLVLAGLAATAAVVATGYAPATGLPLLLLVSVSHAAVLAPLNPIADALALAASRAKPGFEYGWVRGAGSAAFIVGMVAAGWCVDRAGSGIIVWLNAGLLAAAASVAWRVPARAAPPRPAGIPAGTVEPAGSIRDLLALPVFRRLMLVAALIGGSHALHDGFEVIRWRAAGLSASQSGLLWAVSVGAEVGVFLYLGRRLLARLGPANALALAGLAGVVRWGATAETAAFPVMAVIEPLHGLTFALLHLACMEIIGRAVPVRLAATAQAFYATIAMGAAWAAVTLAGGSLYGAFGPGAFWAMAGMCALAIPLARGLRVAAPDAPATPRAKAATGPG